MPPAAVFSRGSFHDADFEVTGFAQDGDRYIERMLFEKEVETSEWHFHVEQSDEAQKRREHGPVDRNAPFFHIDGKPETRL